MEVEPDVTRAAGIFLIVGSLTGLYFNVCSFLHFKRLEKSSFSLFCLSKCVSNSMILLVYLFYDGPTALIYKEGPLIVNRILNEAAAYGVYFHGPLVQFFITINRLLVVWSVSPRESPYSRHVTYGALFIAWALSFLLTFARLPRNCMLRFAMEELSWRGAGCHSNHSFVILYAVTVLAVLSMAINLIVAARIAVTAKSTILSVQTIRNRRKSRIRMFVQSCFQDSVYLFDTFNSMYFKSWSHSRVYHFLMTIGSNLITQTADGFVMFAFNYWANRTKKAAGTRNISRISPGKQ